MKRDLGQPFTTPENRTIGYMGVFLLGSVLSAFATQFATYRSITPSIGIILGSTLIGLLFICEHRVLSRIVSAATLFSLSFLSLMFGHSSIPDAYILILALGISFLGALPVLHRSYSIAKTILYSVITISASLLLSGACMYTERAITNMAIYSKHP